MKGGGGFGKGWHWLTKRVGRVRQILTFSENGLKYRFLSNLSGRIDNFSTILYFLSKMVIQEEGGIEYINKTDVAKGGGFGKC